MRLDDSPHADPELMAAARRWLHENGDLTRTAMASTGFDAAADSEEWQRLVALGWTGLRLPETVGGPAASLTQLGSLIEATGEALCGLPLAEHSMAIELLLGCPASAARDLGLGAAARGRHALAMGGPAAGEGELLFLPATTDGGGWRVHGRIRLAHGAAQADWLIAAGRIATVASTGSKEVLVGLPTKSAGVCTTAGRGLDGRQAAELVFDGVFVPAEAALAHGAAARQAIDRGRDIGRLLLCVEACGIARRLLEMTVDHLKNRHQFGQPLARFQVLQHRAADMLIGATYARDLAWDTLARLSATEAESGAHARPPGELHHDVLATKLEVLRNVRVVAEQAIQLHGGMGVSDESPVSHAYRRVLVIDARLGSRQALLHELHRDRHAVAVRPPGDARGATNQAPPTHVP
jgi:alkylation response protein AidB-like acyl-CoA dehydrogenase